MIRKLFKVLRCVLIGGANPVYETMTRVELKDISVRVWREEDCFTTGPDPSIEALVIDCIKHSFSMKEIAMSVGGQPRVSAIEVLRRDGCGGLFYADWR